MCREYVNAMARLLGFILAAGLPQHHYPSFGGAFFCLSIHLSEREEYRYM